MNDYRTFVKTKSKTHLAKKIARNNSHISNSSEVSGYLADFRLQNFENFKQIALLPEQKKKPEVMAKEEKRRIWYTPLSPCDAEFRFPQFNQRKKEARTSYLCDSWTTELRFPQYKQRKKERSYTATNCDLISLICPYLKHTTSNRGSLGSLYDEVHSKLC